MSTCDSLCGHGGRALVFLLTAGGCTCAFFAVSTCEFFSYTSSQPSQLPPPYTNITEGFVGLLASYDADGECRVYDNVFIDYAKQPGASAFLITAQFAAVLGPGLGAIAFLLNLLEWCCYHRSCTYFFTVACLILACCFQGLSFIVYGQREFCFDPAVSQNCELEIGAILSMSAAGAFYVATIAWCCLSRNPPLCCSSGYPSPDEPPPQKLPDDRGYPSAAYDDEEPINLWNAALQPQQQQQQQTPYVEEQQYGGPRWLPPTQQPPPYPDEHDAAYAESSYAQPYEQPSAPRGQQEPAPSWQHPTAPWNPNDPYGTSGAPDPYANPFAANDPAAPSYEYQRPAYGNLQ